MRVLARLSVFALAPLVGGVCRAAGVAAAAEGASAVARFLADRLSDQSLRVADALRDAADRAWATLDRALAGDSALAAVDRAEDRAFREQLRLFVLAAQCDGRATADPTFVPRCRDELAAAKAAGLLAGDADPAALAEGLGNLTRYDEPTALLAAQWGVADALAADLHGAGYTALAALVALRPASDPTAAPLLAVAVRYYFRRSVEDDPKLFQGLAFAQLERL
ncbi:hypothetical protein J0H58_00235, partial [bacterium]|nr:hypothetical protein [bacterium]